MGVQQRGYSRRDALRALGAMGAGACSAGGAEGGEPAQEPRDERAGGTPPTLFETDVLVVGGGPAGMCAAVTAAREGARVAVVERWPMLGGLATMGGVNTWHTSNLENEYGFGLTQEFIEQLKQYDGVDRHPNFPRVHGTYSVSPYWLQVVYDDFVTKHKIRTLCYTACVDAVVSGRTIRAAVVGTKRGLRTIRASRFVDASGSGDLGYHAGCETVVGRESDGKTQGMTLVTMWGNLDESRRDEIVRAHGDVDRLMRRLIAEGKFPQAGGFSFGLNFLWRWRCSLDAVTSGDPLDEEDLTRATMEARAKVPKLLRFFRENYPGLENLELDFLGSTLGVRESRRVLGRYVFDAPDVLGRRSFPDAIGHGFWMIDIHDPEGSGYTTWRDKDRHLKPGETYQIPYRMLVAKDLDNLLVAGRCASATHQGMAAVRIQTHCHLMGQAAGFAAAMSLENNIPPANIDVAKLQQRLIDNGVYIDRQRTAQAAAARLKPPVEESA